MGQTRDTPLTKEDHMRTAIIGGGFMGEALIAALRRREVAHPADIVVADVARDRRDHLHGRYGVAEIGRAHV